MLRRKLVTLAASALAVPAVIGTLTGKGWADGSSAGGLGQALRKFLKLPGKKSYLLHVGDDPTTGWYAYQPNLLLFTASAFKTFVLAQYLRDVEAGRLLEDQELPIDDSVRTLGSPVFLDLTGTTMARVVLEAMITHSDNTATDLAMLKAGVGAVRALIAKAGLRSIRIPDSTRIFASYILGAPAGVDLGWPGILDAAKHPPGPTRPLLNPVVTLAGTARDFVSWYEQALAGVFFAKPETLVEFKRIQAMSDQIVKTVPANTPAWAKGGEVGNFNGSNAKSFAGQMLARGNTPVTFCFIVNWTSSQNDFPAVEAEFFAAIARVLIAVG
ncbi:MAG: serine hydrolase [Stellaceae bacterium]